MTFEYPCAFTVVKANIPENKEMKRNNCFIKT